MALNKHKEAYPLLECDQSHVTHRTVEILGFYKYSTDLKVIFQFSLDEDL